MLVFEAKLQGTAAQYGRLDEAIRTGLFIRNSCLRYWLDGHGKSRNDLNRYCKVLADNPEFPWAKKLNSMARQAMAERAWAAVARLYENCAKNKPGKKGFPKFKRLQTRASVEYKTSGWKLSEDRRYITFTDGFEAGTFKLWGTRDLHFYQLEQIKRIRIVRRSDGYYVQLCIAHERVEQHEFKNRMVGLDMGLTHFLTDSDGNQVENPRYLRKSEKALKRLQRRVSRKEKGSKNRAKGINRLGRKHLKVQRQRKDFAVHTALCVIQSADLVAIEDLKVRNMVKNRHLAKSISDAAWSMFRTWLEYFGRLYGVPVIAIAPHYTSSYCSSCGYELKKSLSIRTHVCPHCGYIADRDWNAALNILAKALNTVGHTGINACGENDLCTEEETIQCKPTRRSRKPKEQSCGTPPSTK
jgi:putative transposase